MTKTWRLSVKGNLMLMNDPTKRIGNNKLPALPFPVNNLLNIFYFKSHKRRTIKLSPKYAIETTEVGVVANSIIN